MGLGNDAARAFGEFYNVSVTIHENDNDRKILCFWLIVKECLDPRLGTPLQVSCIVGGYIKIFVMAISHIVINILLKRSCDCLLYTKKERNRVLFIC